MKTVVFIQKELEDWWGVEDLLADNADLSSSEKTLLIVELLTEDLPALLDGAKWKVARVPDEQPRRDWTVARGGMEGVNMTDYAEEFRARVLAASVDEIVCDFEWVFWPTENKGYYTAAALRVLADELDRRNEELEKYGP